MQRPRGHLYLPQGEIKAGEYIGGTIACRNDKDQASDRNKRMGVIIPYEHNRKRPKSRNPQKSQVCAPLRSRRTASYVPMQLSKANSRNG